MQDVSHSIIGLKAMIVNTRIRIVFATQEQKGIYRPYIFCSYNHQTDSNRLSSSTLKDPGQVSAADIGTPDIFIHLCLHLLTVN